MKLEYTALERLPCPRPVDKLSWIADLCRDKYVLDLGAYDETAVALKQGTPYWLHERLSRVAKEVLGVDNSDLLPDDGLSISENSMIVRGDILHLESVSLGPRTDVVVAGELIEHLPDALEFLCQLREDPRLKGATALLTTPNASAFYNVVLGMAKRESTHHDHLAIFSFKTLNTLCSRAGFDDWELIPYHARFPELFMSSSGLTRLWVKSFQRLVNAVERMFPMLAGGWIVRARL